ncbi:MAG: hypothetical protein VXZ38_00870, partial [Planctomycetota bacterium]|nr:hypothetical protein [Planctomycetota bacterium]
ARWHGTSKTSACLAGILYSLSGSVLFLHTNLPFLVSAAWLPLALAPMLCTHPTLQKRQTFYVSIALTMMILGGDPQTAFHCVLVFTGILFIRCIRKSNQIMRPRQLIVAVALTLVVSAPQLAASIDWSRQSERVTEEKSTNDILRAPSVESRRYDTFAFSVPPWHWIELFSPAPFGHLYPVNTRMSLRFSGEARTWTPSLYMGSFVGFICLLSLSSRNRKRTHGWLIISIMGITASLGAYGLVWLIQYSTGTLQEVDGSVGGVYWLLYWMIPNYDAFRYPAKWLPFFAIGLSVASAIMMDRPSTIERLRRMITPAFLLFTLLAIVAWTIHLSDQIIASPIQQWIPKDPFWGPLQIGLAWKEITLSLMHSSFISAGFIIIFWLNSRYHWRHPRLRIILTALVFLDLTLASEKLILMVSNRLEGDILSQFHDTRVTRSLNDRPIPVRWLRTRSGSGWPMNWQETSSKKRAAEVQAAGRLNWFGRWHLSDRTAVFNSASSIRSAAVSSFWRVTQSVQQGRDPRQKSEDWQRIQSWLGIDGVITSKSDSMEVETQADRYSLPTITYQVTASHKTGTDPAVTHHVNSKLELNLNWRVVSANGPIDKLMEERLNEIIHIEPTTNLDSLKPDLHPHAKSTPWLFLDDQSVQPHPAPGSHKDEKLGWRCIQSDEENAIFRVEATHPVLICRAVYQDGNWQARLRTKESNQWKSQTVHQVDFLKQGVVVPPGIYFIQFYYQPWWLTLSGVLSLSGCILMTTLAFRGILHTAPE